MAVTIHLYGYLRVMLGTEVITQEWQGGTLRDLLIRLADAGHGVIPAELFDDNGDLDRAYALFANGNRVDDPSARVEDGDDVVITSMLAGG